MGVSFVQSLVLGVVQGLTEFLPVSSSAHLIVVPRLLGWQDLGLAFDVALHMGTLVGVLIYFRSDLLRLAASWLEFRNPARQGDRNLVVYLALATVPAVLAGLLIQDYVETVLRNPRITGFALILGGLALAATDQWSRGERTLASMKPSLALVIGIAQGFALVPGISRSGITIFAALALGFTRPEAARFSFLLSIPVIAGAVILNIDDIWKSPELAMIMAGFVGAAFSGYFAIWGLLKFVQSHRFTPFVLYRLALGTAILSLFR